MTVWRPDSWPWASKPTSSAYLRNSRIWKWHKNAGQEKTNIQVTYKSHTSHIQVTSSHIKSHKTSLVSVGFHCTCGLIAARLKVALLLKLITTGSRWLTNGWPMVDQWLTHLGTTKMVSLGLVDTQSHSPTFGLSATHSAIKSMTRYEHSTHKTPKTPKTHKTRRAVPPAMARFPAQTWHPHGQSLANCKMLLWLSFIFIYIYIYIYIILYCSENAHENGRRLRNDQHVQSCLRVNSHKYAWVVLPPSFMNARTNENNERKLEKRLLTYERTKLINITLTQHHITAISHLFVTLLQPHIIPTSPYFKTHITSTTHYLNLTSHQAQITSTSHCLNITLQQPHISSTSHDQNLRYISYIYIYILYYIYIIHTYLTGDQWDRRSIKQGINGTGDQ